MSESKYIKKIQINSYAHLVKIVQGKTSYCNDLREKFIFRGVEDYNYELKPSALRKENKLIDFVDEDFKLTLVLTHEQAVKGGFCEKHDYYSDTKDFTVNKYGKIIKTKSKDFAWSLEEFQCVKELNALLNFFSYADKVGLKVPTNQTVRQFLEHDFKNMFDHEKSFWPDENYYELMALGQHYGVPTRSLDWSYDYKVSLYFAVKNVLNDNYLHKEKPTSGVLWAFNYKYFNTDRMTETKTYRTIHYRPEYASNPNLNAQKGLFTFMIKRVNEDAHESYDKFIENLLDNYPQVKRRIPTDESVFYKFIIPEEEKPNILKELYSESYSEEYLFPGYAGVSQTIENRIKLDKIIKTKELLKDYYLIMDE